MCLYIFSAEIAEHLWDAESSVAIIFNLVIYNVGEVEQHWIAVPNLVESYSRVGPQARLVWYITVELQGFTVYIAGIITWSVITIVICQF